METIRLKDVFPNTFFIYNGRTYIRARQVVTIGEYRVLVREIATDTLILLPAHVEVMVT